MAPKGKKSKKADDNWDEGLGEPADGVVDSPAGDVEEPQDDDVGGGLMATLRKNKEKRKKKGKADDEQEDLADKAPVEASMDDEFAETGKIKTKAEKEKEKKEREKARKKEQAAAKKKTPAAPPPKVEEKVVEVVEVKPEPAGGKKKKLNPALAALQKQQEELRRRQEEDAKSVAEEQARIAREEKEAEEEEKRKAEQKAAKKEREKQKVLELKKQGLYKTDKQKKDEAQAKLRLQQMLESGTAKVAGIDGDDTTRKPKERKRNPRKEAEERKAREEAEAERRALELRQKEEQKVEPVVEEPKEESEDELDDWEAMAEKEESVAVPTKATVTPTKEESKEEDSEDDDDEDDSDEDSSSEDEKETATQRQVRERKEQAHAKRQQQIEDARNAGSKDNLRSPIAVILGHVDTGKTSLLDRVRQTSVQAGEAGGITQQIGATYFPADALRTKTQVVNKDGGFAFKIPGLLIIDTPGHESFSNLRSRGSSLCNIAILVVDLFHGLEPQTLESMKLLRDRKTPFIVALNKVDRCYGWKAIKDNGFQDSLAQQNNAVQSEFHDRVEKTKLLFAEEGFNAELYYKNKNLSRYVSLVPTSAITGEGVPDLLKLLIMLTQERMAGQLMYLSEVEATVLEVKPIDGLGTTIDVILSNGYLREGDTAVLCGTEGPIVFQIRALLTPGEMKELRVKGSYVHHKEVKAALGVKITGPGLDNAIAGSRLLIAKDPDDEDEIEELCDDVMEDLEGLMGKISRTGRGVTVAASTLGSLEALLSFLSAMKIPVGNISIGTVHKRDVVTASTMLEKASEYAMMLCFDVKIERDAQELADSLGIKVFSAPIIYHLFDRFREHQAAILAKKKEEAKLLAVWPCVLTQLAVFNKIDPIVIGVDVAEGTLKVGCPIAAVKVNPTTKAKEVISLGRVTSIERDHKQIPSCKKNQPSVAVKIEGPNQPTYGRQVDESMTLYSLISRKTIDTLKEFHRDETTKEEWTLIAKHLKPLFDIQ